MSTEVEPLVSAAGVKVSSPLASTAGCDENSDGSSAVTVNVRVWDDSLAGPLDSAVAHPVAA